MPRNPVPKPGGKPATKLVRPTAAKTRSRQEEPQARRKRLTLKTAEVAQAVAAAEEPRPEIEDEEPEVLDMPSESPIEAFDSPVGRSQQRPVSMAQLARWSTESGEGGLPAGGDKIEEDATWHFRMLFPGLLRAESVSIAAARAFFADNSPERNPDRLDMVNWIIRIHGSYSYRDTTLFLAVQVMDSFLNLPLAPRQRPLLLAATSLMIASKFEEELPPETAGLVAEGSGQFSAFELWQMELAVLHRLGFRLHKPTAAHHLYWFQATFHKGCGTRGYDGSVLRQLAQYLAELGLTLPGAAHWAPSLHAAAAVILAGAMLNRPDDDMRKLKALCDANSGLRLAYLIRIVAEMLEGLQDCRWSSTIYRKYMGEEFGCVAAVAERLYRELEPSRLRLT